MSELRYNGITLKVVRCHSYNREPIYDGFTYLYTRHTISVEAVFSPSTTSVDFSNQPQDPPQSGVNPPPPGVLGPGGAVGGLPTSRGTKTTSGGSDDNNGNLTDRAVRHLLEQKRGRLVFTAGASGTASSPYQAHPTFRGGAQASILLDVPETLPANARGVFKDPNFNPEFIPDPEGDTSDPLLTDDARRTLGSIPWNTNYVVDCTDGPTPLKCDIWRIDGTGTLRISYAIRADINESRFFFNKPPILLSHNWSMSTDIGEQGLAVRIIRGRAIFRRDVLEMQIVTPESYRGLLVHPIPENMVRESLVVTQEEDGNSLSYQSLDREMTHRNGAPNVTKIEAQGRIGMRRGSLWKTGAQLTIAGLSIAGGALTGNLSNIATGVLNILPRAYIDATVKVWGNNKTKQAYLRNVGQRILVNRLGDVTDAQNTYIVEENYDWAGRFVEIHWHIELAGILAAADIANLDQLITQAKNVADGANLFIDVQRRRLNNMSVDSTVETNADGQAALPFPKGFVYLDGRLHPQPKPGRGFQTYLDAAGNTIVGEDGNKGTYLNANLAQSFFDSSACPPAPPGTFPLDNIQSLEY